jgi:hypothetical protein
MLASSSRLKQKSVPAARIAAAGASLRESRLRDLAKQLVEACGRMNDEFLD